MAIPVLVVVQFTPPILGRQCLVGTKQCVPRQRKIGSWIGEAI